MKMTTTTTTIRSSGFYDDVFKQLLYYPTKFIILYIVCFFNYCTINYIVLYGIKNVVVWYFVFVMSLPRYRYTTSHLSPTTHTRVIIIVHTCLTLEKYSVILIFRHNLIFFVVLCFRNGIDNQYIVLSILCTLQLTAL